MNIQQIFKNNEAWVREKLKHDPDYFKTLSEGQHPEILYIGCSDSRVSASELMGIKPGEAFIHRNIANLVSSHDIGMLATIDYAIVHLKVKHIVVCGHYNCGGVKAAMQSSDLGILNPWLRDIRDVYRCHVKELDQIPSEEEKYKRLVELNVQEQCINLIKTLDVQHAIRERELYIHGWVFDMHSGKLIDLEIDEQKIMDGIMDIYRLD